MKHKHNFTRFLNAFSECSLFSSLQLFISEICGGIKDNISKYEIHNTYVVADNKLNYQDT